MLKFNGFYISKSAQATIEAPTATGEYSFESYMMYRFYETGIWIKANSLDTSSKEFWEVSQGIGSEELLKGLKTGSIFHTSLKNHHLQIGQYEIEDGFLFVSHEARISEEIHFSDMYSWAIEENKLISDEGDFHLSLKSV